MSTASWKQTSRTPKREAEVVAGFELGPVIGIGTYGEVRCARKLANGKRVAIKIVDMSRFNSDVEALMAKEMQMLREVEHANCIRLLEVHEKVAYSGTDHSGFETRKVMFLVEELAAGGELFGILMQTGKLAEPVARYYFRQLIEGVDHLHSRGIAHRDLKPENLVLDAHFQLKIVDFGLAAHFSETRPLLHSGVGSQPYSAPEVYYSKELFAQQGYTGPPADIWSCAVILFVLLSGRPPFVRPLARNFGGLRRCKHFINLLRGRGYGSISEQARDLLMMMFRPNPAERPSIDDIKAHPWYNGPVPDEETLAKIMSEKSYEVWRQQNKTQMIEVLEKVRRDLTVTPRLRPVDCGDDPFAHANVRISLLTLAETGDPMHRTLPHTSQTAAHSVPPCMNQTHAQGTNATANASAGGFLGTEVCAQYDDAVDACVLDPKRAEDNVTAQTVHTAHTQPDFTAAVDMVPDDLALVREWSAPSSGTEGEHEQTEAEEDEGADEEKQEDVGLLSQLHVVSREGESEEDEQRQSLDSVVRNRGVLTPRSQEGSDADTDENAVVAPTAYDR